MYPFERFSENSKACLTLAQAEAEMSGQSYMGTEHLFLALFQERNGSAAVALKELGLELSEVRASVARMVTDQPRRRLVQHIIPTSRVKRVIELAFEEARRDQFDRVETGHLLIALALEGDGIAARVLRERGLTAEELRSRLTKLREAGMGEQVGAGPPPMRQHLSLNDAKGRPVAVDVLFPYDYPEDERDQLMLRIQRTVVKGETKD